MHRVDLHFIKSKKSDDSGESSDFIHLHIGCTKVHKLGSYFFLLKTQSLKNEIKAFRT